jgi:hypothetical protein
MPRWKLTAKHYLQALQFGQPSEWQREEINVQTGRAFRKTYPVPMFIDPDDPFCINRHVGYCVVATEGSDQPGDLIVSNFKPTPDMEPLDEEARTMSEAERPNWINPIDGLSPMMGEDFANQLLAALQQQMNQTSGVSPSQLGVNSEVSNLSTLVAAQQRQIDQLLAALSGRSAEGEARHAAPSGDEVIDYDPANHVSDDLEPLPSNEEVEAAQKAAAGLTKTPLKVPHPARRI